MSQFRKLPLVAIILNLLNDVPVMTFVSFTVFAVLTALFGEGLEEYQSLIVYGVFFAGVGFASGAWAKDIIFQWARVNADQLSRLAAKGIDAFESATHSDIPDEIEVLIVDRLNGALKRLPLKLGNIEPTHLPKV